MKNENRIPLLFSLVLASAILFGAIFLSVFAQTVTITADVAIVCGNSVLDSGEQCDGSALGGQTCVNQGYTGGTLSCNANCTFDVSGCSSASPVGEIIVGPGGGGGGGGFLPPPKPTAEAIKLCDFNGDKKCDIVDLSIMLFYFNKPVTPVSSKYDLNSDGKLNIVDVSILFYYWA
ncbi:MAG: dockerin type I domain-containing protein [Patescibacteria group bacterium]